MITNLRCVGAIAVALILASTAGGAQSTAPGVTVCVTQPSKVSVGGGGKASSGSVSVTGSPTTGIHPKAKIRVVVQITGTSNVFTLPLVGGSVTFKDAVPGPSSKKVKFKVNKAALIAKIQAIKNALTTSILNTITRIVEIDFCLATKPLTPAQIEALENEREVLVQDFTDLTMERTAVCTALDGLTVTPLTFAGLDVIRINVDLFRPPSIGPNQGGVGPFIGTHPVTANPKIKFGK